MPVSITDNDTLLRLWQEVRRNMDALPANPVLFEDVTRAWLHRLMQRSQQPIAGNAERAAQYLQRLKAVVIDHGFAVTHTLPTGPGTNASATGMLNTRTKVIYVEPRCPIHMLHTLMHEIAHAFLLGSGLAEHVSDDGQEVIADATAALVLARLGFDALPHSAAYITPYVCGDGVPPDTYDTAILEFANAIEGKLTDV
jgi:hypothetical protein